MGWRQAPGVGYVKDGGSLRVRVGKGDIELREMVRNLISCYSYS